MLLSVLRPSPLHLSRSLPLTLFFPSPPLPRVPLLPASLDRDPPLLPYPPSGPLSRTWERSVAASATDRRRLRCPVDTPVTREEDGRPARGGWQDPTGDAARCAGGDRPTSRQTMWQRERKQAERL